MPTINVRKDLLMQELGMYTDEQFGELCFQFGVELDEVISLPNVTYKIDIPANRYDLLSLEGFVLAMKIFTGKMKPPVYKIKPSGVILQANTVWPILLGAIVRVKLSKDQYDSLFDLQEKLEQNIGRKKKILTIDTHDLDLQNAPITPDTTNILIKVNSTDKEKAAIALDAIVSMLVSINSSFAAESVEVKYRDGTTQITPNMDYHKESIEVSYINEGLGINLNGTEMADLLTRMSLKANVTADGKSLEVFIPPTRHDIIHKCDVMEDVGIAFGYDNIVKTLPKCSTIATQVPLNKLSDQLRHEISRCGYTEALNFALCSENDLCSMLRQTEVSDFVKIKNPKTIEFQVARTRLLPGLMRTLNSNANLPLPMKLFEVSDVVFADTSKDVGARNERHLAAIYYGKQTSGFETIHGLLDRIMQILESPYIGEKADKKTMPGGYYIEPTNDDRAYLEGRCAAIIYDGQRIGFLGILHPEVLANFELNHPASALEIRIDMFPFVREN